MRLLCAALASLLCACPLSAQWVRLQRCAGALPCSVPFGIRYAPDPLLAAHYGRMSETAVAVRVTVEKKPEVALETPPLSKDPSEEAARRFLIAHPPPGKRDRPAKAPTSTP